jgi:hypothetical protein
LTLALTPWNGVIAGARKQEAGAEGSMARVLRYLTAALSWL